MLVDSSDYSTLLSQLPAVLCIRVVVRPMTTVTDVAQKK
jgi:hypothetical protein